MGEFLEPVEDALALTLRDPFRDPTDAFITALNAPSAAVRERTAALVRRYPSSLLVPALLDRLREESDAQTQAEIIESLGFMRVESAVPLILRFAESPHELTRANVAEALGIIAVRSPRITRTLLALLDDPEPVVRCYAAEALGDVGDSPVALVALRERQVQDASWLVRVWCIYGRARQGDRIDWDTLRIAFGKPERMVRKQAMIVLRHLADDANLSQMADLLREAHRTETDDSLADEMDTMLHVVEKANAYP